MGSASRPLRDMHEVFYDSSSQHMQKHQAFVQSFVDRGYEIESQDVQEDKGAGNELILRTLTSVVKPVKNFELPMLKFIAKEIYGKYDDYEMSFLEWDEPKFELKAYRKGADVHSFRDPWQPFDVD